MIDSLLKKIKKYIPTKLFRMGQPVYHYSLAWIGAVLYRFPSKKIRIVSVTGTKGKSSTVELVNAILEAAGKKTALAGTVRFKIGNVSTPNRYKMTMPGRFFIQKFLRDAVNAGCDYAVIEISSEAAAQYRHKFIDLDALIFTNLAPEHIESHGSYENYVRAKLSIAEALAHSHKKEKILVVNRDDAEAEKFLRIAPVKHLTYSLADASAISFTNDMTTFTYQGIVMRSPLPGTFNIYNMLGAMTYAQTQGIDLFTMQSALAKLTVIRGRGESIRVSDAQNFKVIVDYAHTPDSLRAIYSAYPSQKKIGVLGSCGGGRDKWKRKEMAQIADKFCETVILTDEDPYDDDPREIVNDMAQFFIHKKPEIIMDRRAAIARAISLAQKDSAIIITGKGTDPYIMRANGAKEPWSDADVATEELKKIFA